MYDKYFWKKGEVEMSKMLAFLFFDYLYILVCILPIIVNYYWKIDNIFFLQSTIPHYSLSSSNP